MKFPVGIPKEKIILKNLKWTITIFLALILLKLIKPLLNRE